MRQRLDRLALIATGRLRPAAQDRVMGALRPLIWRGDNVECPVCGGRFERFLPYWNRDYCRCPRCDSHERHRALWLYLQRRTDLLTAPHHVLHLAPEPSLVAHLRRRPNLDYVSADLDSPLAMLHFDIQDIPFRDATFDAVLCGHVLTEVPDDRLAMREMRRVLRPGGWAIVMAAVEPDRETTYEDPSITDPEARRAAFLEPLNVRVYGADFADRLREAGFEVEAIPWPRVLGDDDIRRFGLLPADEIYWCRA
jgi:SAM-dependent methyltransferase